MSVQEYAAKYGVTRPKPWQLDWLIFFELGGDYAVLLVLLDVCKQVISSA